MYHQTSVSLSMNRLVSIQSDYVIYPDSVSVKRTLSSRRNSKRIKKRNTNH